MVIRTRSLLPFETRGRSYMQAGPHVMGLCKQEVEEQRKCEEAKEAHPVAGEGPDCASGSGDGVAGSSCSGLATEILARRMAIRTRFVDDFFEDCTMSRDIKQVNHPVHITTEVTVRLIYSNTHVLSSYFGCAKRRDTT